MPNKVQEAASSLDRARVFRFNPAQQQMRRIAAQGGTLVKPAPFAYAKARSLEHAIELLTQQDGARVLAGGQSLIATLNMRLDTPNLLVDINGIPGLDGIARKNEQIEIG